MFSLAKLMEAVSEDRKVPARATSVPTPASAGESSGLIDLRAIQTLIGQRGPHADLLVVRTVTPPSPPPRVQASPIERRLSLVLAIIMLATAGLAGVLLLRAASRSGPMPLLPQIFVAPEEDPEQLPPIGRVVLPEVAAPEMAEPEAETPATESTRETQPHRRTERKPVGEGPRRVEPPKQPAPEKVAPPEDMPVACLLDMTKCPRKRTDAPAPAPSEPVPSVSLPATLEPADIGEGTRAAKSAAVEKCKALAKGGETIKVRLSIAGPAGSVLRATPEDDAGNAQLAACCARELMSASFKKVAKPQIGAVVTVKF